MASSLGMVEADPAPGPRIGVRGRLFVGDSSGRHDGAAGCYFHSKGMKMASSLGMVEADPAPGPSSGTPQDDMTGRPGAIFIAMTDVGVLYQFAVMPPYKG